MIRKFSFVLTIILLVIGVSAFPEALAAEANYDESKIPPYILPDLLTTAAGEKTDSVEAWEKTRRPEILELFREHMFGRAPGRPEGMTSEAREGACHFLAGFSANSSPPRPANAQPLAFPDQPASAGSQVATGFSRWLANDLVSERASARLLDRFSFRSAHG